MNLKELALKYFAAFSNQDLDALSNMLDDYVTLRDWNVSVTGKDNVLVATKQIFDSVDTIHVRVLGLILEANYVAAELEITVNGTNTLLVADIITFSQQKITNIRAYKGDNS